MVRKPTLEETIDLLRRKGSIRLFDGASENDIAQFENRQGTKLPKQIKDFLLITDGGEFFLPAGAQIYGVNHKPFIVVAEEFIVIGTLANGDPILCPINNKQVCVFNQERGVVEVDEIYVDFSTFLRNLPILLGIIEGE